MQVKRYLKVIDVQVTHCGQCPAARKVTEDRDVKQPIYCCHESVMFSRDEDDRYVGWWRTNGYEVAEDREPIPDWCPLEDVE